MIVYGLWQYGMVLNCLMNPENNGNNRINSDWQLRCAPLPVRYAGRWDDGDNIWMIPDSTEYTQRSRKNDWGMLQNCNLLFNIGPWLENQESTIRWTVSRLPCEVILRFCSLTPSTEL